MEVDALPAHAILSPNPGFLESIGDRPPVRIRALDKARVADHADLIEYPNMGRADRADVLPKMAAKFEVEPVELQPLNNVPPGLGLEAGQVLGAQRGVRLPIT